MDVLNGCQCLPCFVNHNRNYSYYHYLLSTFRLPDVTDRSRPSSSAVRARPSTSVKSGKSGHMISSLGHPRRYSTSCQLAGPSSVLSAVQCMDNKKLFTIMYKKSCLCFINFYFLNYSLMFINF